LDGTPTYGDGLRTLDWSGFTIAQGGSDIDAFAISANTPINLRGGANLDSFALANGVTLFGSLDGEAGSDTLNFSAATTPVAVTLTSPGVSGFNGLGR
jgi:hypothetical protein